MTKIQAKDSSFTIFKILVENTFIFYVYLYICYFLNIFYRVMF